MSGVGTDQFRQFGNFDVLANAAHQPVVHVTAIQIAFSARIAATVGRIPPCVCVPAILAQPQLNGTAQFSCFARRAPVGGRLTNTELKRLHMSLTNSGGKGASSHLR